MPNAIGNSWEWYPVLVMRLVLILVITGGGYYPECFGDTPIQRNETKRYYFCLLRPFLYVSNFDISRRSLAAKTWGSELLTFSRNSPDIQLTSCPGVKLKWAPEASVLIYIHIYILTFRHTKYTS